MIRLPVASSSIASVGYDKAAATLEVEFVSGALYRYYRVQPAVFADLLEAPSKGRFVNASIRDAYAYARVGRGAGLRHRPGPSCAARP